jgi:hypothetical protein
MFEKGLLNLAGWSGNVILPTLAGLLFASAVFRFSRSQPSSHLSAAGFASLMCSGLLRVLESFAQRAVFDDPDRYWISLIALVNWTANVMLPLYGALQVAAMAVYFGGVLERTTIGDAWVRNLLSAMMCFSLSGLLRLAESWIQNGTAGVR